MATGLFLSGNVRTGASYGAGAPSTATEAAFGPGYTQPGTPSRTNALTPNDPFGVAFWAGIISLGLLMLIRHSLPQ